MSPGSTIECVKLIVGKDRVKSLFLFYEYL